MKSQIIALYSPAAQSGKSTVAQHLMEHHGFHLVKFAGPLKNMMRTLLQEMYFTEDYIEELIEGSLKHCHVNGLPVSVRSMMQTLGTEWGRNCVDPDLWTRVAITQAKWLRSDGLNVVMDDMRFPNEFDAVKAAGGITVKVIRPGYVPDGSHSSEGQLDDHQFDYVIFNDGPVDDLSIDIETLMHVIKHDQEAAA